MEGKICKKVFNEIIVSVDRKGRPIFSLCCYMDRNAWFRADSIAEALSSESAKKIRENALGNRHGYCSEGCPNWKDHDGNVPGVSIERFEISNSTMCNARCVFCFQADYDISLPKEIIEEWRRDYLPKVRHAAFGGGEPLVVAFPLIMEVAEKRPDAGISLVTNGILLNRVLGIHNRISGINISLNAGSREVYKDVLKVDCFDKVVANIRSFREAGYAGLMSATYVICRENVNDIGNFLRLCAELKINKAGFNLDRTDPQLKVPPDLEQKIKEKAMELGVKVSIGKFNVPLSFAAKGKQMLLYYLRYKGRRNKER